MPVISKCYKSKVRDGGFNAIWRLGTGELYILSIESPKGDQTEKRPGFLFYGDDVRNGLTEYIEKYGRFLRCSGSYYRNASKKTTNQTSLAQVLAALYHGFDTDRAKLIDVQRKIITPVTIRADITDQDGHKLDNRGLNRFLKAHKVYDLTPENLVVNHTDLAKHVHSTGFLFDGRLTVGNQEFFIPYETTANRDFKPSFDFYELLENVGGWHIGNSGAECSLEDVKNAHLSVAHLVVLYWCGELDDLLEQFKAGKLSGSELLVAANDRKNRRTKNGLVIEHFAEDQRYNLPHALAWADIGVNSAFRARRTAVKKPYFFYMAHDCRSKTIKVVCGAEGWREFRFIFDEDDLTKPAQKQDGSLPENEICQCLECFRAFAEIASKTRIPSPENLLTKSVNRQMEHMRRGKRTLPDVLEDVANLPDDSFSKYVAGAFEDSKSA